MIIMDELYAIKILLSAIIVIVIYVAFILSYIAWHIRIGNVMIEHDDEDIETSEIEETDEEWFKRANLRR